MSNAYVTPCWNTNDSTSTTTKGSLLLSSATSVIKLSLSYFIKQQPSGLQIIKSIHDHVDLYEIVHCPVHRLGIHDRHRSFQPTINSSDFEDCASGRKECNDQSTWRTVWNRCCYGWSCYGSRRSFGSIQLLCSQGTGLGGETGKWAS